MKKKNESVENLLTVLKQQQELLADLHAEASRARGRLDACSRQLKILVHDMAQTVTQIAAEVQEIVL